MAKKRLTSENPIPNYDTPWESIDPTNGMPYGGDSVEKFLKGELKKKAAVFFFDPKLNIQYGFASEEDKDMWLNGGGDSYVLTQTPFNFSGTMNQIKINAEGGTNLVFTTTQDKCLLNMTFTSEQKGITDTQWEEVFEDFIVTAYVDRGAQGSFTEIGSATQVMNGKPYSIDVKKYLMTGSNRVRISVKGAITGTTANLIYNIQVTTMYLQPANFNWYTPYEEGKIDYAIGGFNIGGSINKVMKFHITNEALGYDEIFEDNIGTDLYVNRAYQWSNVPFPSTGTGVYRVEAWLDANGLESDHFVYNIMCVAEVDKDTAQLVCMNEVSTKIMNGQDNKLFGYAVYNNGTSTASPTVTLEALGETIVTETLNDVTTSAKYYYNYALEVENESLSFNMDMGIALGESVASQRVVVDNSASFHAADNAVFYMNAAKRNNSQSNRELIVNEVDGSSVNVEWTNIGWKADGWTTDDEGRSCLLIPAGSQANIAYQPLGSVGNGKTIELCYKVKNVADFNENIITIATNPTSAAFQGIQIKPKRISVHSRDLKDTPSQSYPNKDEELVHVLITIVKNYKTNYGNLCQIYVNGGKRTSFDFTGTDSFAAAANIILGNNSADLYVYKMRVYNEGFEWMSAAQNFANCLPDYESKVFAWDKITAAMNDSYQVDFDQVFGKYNTMVIEMRPTPLETGGSVVYPIPNLLQPTGGLCNTWINIIDPKPGELDEDFARLFGGELIADETVEGQGTTAMTYYRWNFRWKLSKAWNKRRITAKKNVASSMHSHKMGATRLYNDMHHACVGQNELNTRVAVFQYPVYGFEKKLIEGTEDQYTYTFIGLYTIGPDKGDKTYFGFDDESVKDTLVHLEGADHTPTGVGMEYPWDECRFDFKNQCLGGINTDTTVEGAWEVGAAGDFDPEAEGDQASIQTMLNSEFKPAYKVAYDNSTYIEGVTDTLEEINADATAFKNSHSGMEVWTDGTYDLYYYHIKDKVYKPNGVNLLTQLGISESELSGKTITEKNELFKAKRRENFRNNMGQYWHQADAIFHYAFCLMIGATDNFKKNTYPYKYYPLSEGGKWRWRQDDLDSILDINNQGFSAKSYSTLVGDLTSTGSGSVFRGDNSVFWTLIREAFPNEVADMVRSILTQMAARGSGNSSIEKCVNYVRSLFWDLAQDYFGEGSYNSDAEWTYEEAWHLRNLGDYTNDVHPLSQSLGSHYEAERDWVELRMVFLASYYNWGAFSTDSGDDTSTGQISFRAAGGKTYDITPAIDFNPTILIGQSALTSANGRIMAGTTAQVTVPDMGNNDTHIYIQGADYYSNIGDLADVQVSADNPVFTVSSKKLRSLKLGDESADNVTSNIRTATIGACPSLEHMDARNLAALAGTIDLTQCPRLKTALFSGTSVANVVIPMGSKVEQLSLPDTITTLTLRGLNSLTWENFDYGTLANLAYLRVEDNAHIDGFEMLRTAYKNSPNLANIRVIGFNVTGDATDIDMIAAFVTAVDENGFKIYSGIDEAGNATTTLPILDGNLTITTPVYQDTLDIVNGYYPNLKIDAPNKYVRFADPEVKRIIVNKWGDGVGITQEQINKITYFERAFVENSLIESFDELELFNGLVEWTAVGEFSKCTSLRSVKMPKHTTSIPASCFGNCTSLERVVLGDGVNKFAGGAFVNCENLSEININQDIVEEIGNQAFSNCKKLPIDVINMPNLKLISSPVERQYAFFATPIKRIESLGQITTVAGFNSCVELVSVKLPSTVIHIEFGCFGGCVNLTNLEYDWTKLVITEKFWSQNINVSIEELNAVNLTGIAYFQSLKIKHVRSLGSITELNEICNYSGGDGTYLESCILPNTLEIIRGGALRQADGLKHIVIPESVTNIEGYAVYGNNITYAVLLNPTPCTISSNWNFNKHNGKGGMVNATYPIYVPDESLEAYKTATGWTQYASRFKPMSEFATDFPDETID